MAHFKKHLGLMAVLVFSSILALSSCEENIELGESKTYTIDYTIEGKGSVRLNKNIAEAGETIDVAIEANNGYYLSKIYINSDYTVFDEIRTNFNFSMPSENVVLTFVFSQKDDDSSGDDDGEDDGTDTGDDDDDSDKDDSG
jgi:hypothetical protein